MEVIPEVAEGIASAVESVVAPTTAAVDTAASVASIPQAGPSSSVGNSSSTTTTTGQPFTIFNSKWDPVNSAWKENSYNTPFAPTKSSPFDAPSRNPSASLVKEPVTNTNTGFGASPFSSGARQLTSSSNTGNYALGKGISDYFTRSSVPAVAAKSPSSDFGGLAMRFMAPSFAPQISLKIGDDNQRAGSQNINGNIK